MKNIMLQKSDNTLYPFRPEDEEALAEIKENQVLVLKVVSQGVKKKRSFQQLKLFMQAIRVVVYNTEDPNWETVDRAKLSLKVALGFIDPNSAVVAPDGSVVLNYRSFGYENLPAMEANHIFDRAFPVLAKVIGVDVDALLEMAKKREY